MNIAVFVAGCVVLLIGIWWLSPAASLITAGLLLIGAAVLSAVMEAARRKPETKTNEGSPRLPTR